METVANKVSSSFSALVRFGPLGVHFGPLGVHFGPLGVHFGPLGVHFGPLGVHFGPLGCPLWPTWCPLWPTLAHWARAHSHISSLLPHTIGPEYIKKGGKTWFMCSIC
jgi:hypothetical protein